MTTFGIDLTDQELTIGWEAIQPEPLTAAETALENARVELAEAWQEVDYWDEKNEAGFSFNIARAQALGRTKIAQKAYDMAWDAVNREKKARLQEAHIETSL